jgi:integrase
MFVVRPPGFGPGSSAFCSVWQADVLDHSSGKILRTFYFSQESPKARLRPPAQELTTQQLKPIPPEIDSKIAYTLIQMKNNGKSFWTVKTVEWTLNHLAHHCNLLEPESVKQYIANATFGQNKRPTSPSTKNKRAFCYDNFCRYNNIKWEKPFFKVSENTPLIPTPENVQAIIDNASQNYSTIFTILAEIGCEPEELHRVAQKDIDAEKGLISITGTKGHASGNYKLKPRTAEMLRRYLVTHTKEHPFTAGHNQSQAWNKYRKRASEKLCKPELLKIELRNLRNYSGERFYKSLPIRDPIAVMRHLRHKKLETTMHYIRAIILDYEEDDQWISRTSKTIEEDAKLIENGFQYVTERDGIKLFRKRK